MTTQLKRFLAPPQFDDYLKNRTAASLTYILYAIIVGLTAGVGLAVTQGTPAEIASVIGALLLMVAAVAALKAGRVELVSQVVPAMLFALIAFIAIPGGLRDLSAYGFAAILAMVALLQGRRGALTYTVLTMVVLTSLYIAGAQGLTAEYFAAATGIDDLIEACLYIGVMGTVLWMLVTNLSAARERAQLQNTQLKQAQTALQALNTDLEARVTERTEQLRLAKEEAEAARDQAVEADRVKSQFLASMSHELRTPLNAIINFTDVILMGVVGPINEQQEELLDRSLVSSRHLLGLINDVLDVTKIHSGMMKLLIEDDIDLNAELKVVADTAITLLKDKPSVAFTYDVVDSLPRITGDRRRIRQVMLNLISNACKFTDEGEVTLRAERRSDLIRFSVVDTGPGIDEKEQDLIFEPFVQTETGVVHANGTGLGLPISKKLVEEHGGRLWVESAHGQGAAFFVELPITGPERVLEAV